MEAYNKRNTMVLDHKIKSKLEENFKNKEMLTFKKGDLVVKPGGILKNVCYLKSGFIRVYTVTEEGKEVTVHIISPSYFLPLITIVLEEENRYYFEALTSVEIWQVSLEEAMDYLKKNPDALLGILKSLTINYRALLRKVEYLISGNAYQKVASLLFSLANVDEKNNKAKIEFKLPHRLIASLAGLTRETVTLQMIKLEKAGLIEIKKGCLVINDFAKLKEESTFEEENIAP